MCLSLRPCLYIRSIFPISCNDGCDHNTCSYTFVSYILQLLFVITDSGQAPEQKPPIPLDETSLPLKSKGVQIYGLAIGGKVPEQNLKDIVSRPENIFTRANSVDDLPQRQPKVVEELKKYLRG